MSKQWLGAGFGAMACICATVAMAQGGESSSDRADRGPPSVARQMQLTEWLTLLITGRSREQDWTGAAVGRRD